MPKIVITEVDNTSPGVLSESTDVVYIPGFVNLDRQTNSGLYNSAGEYVGIKVHEPTLFTSISTFESLCGAEPAHPTIRISSTPPPDSGVARLPMENG